MLDLAETYRKPLSIVLGGRGEQSLHRVVPGNGEAGQVGEELATEVEDDEEEVKDDQADDSIGLGH